jgi:uncharacterized membrane protein
VLSDRATFYLAILFAPLYQFTLGSARLNAPAEGRGARVLLAVGLAAAVITLVTVQEAIGFAGPGIQGLQSLGTLLLAMPLAAVLIAGSR